MTTTSRQSVHLMAKSVSTDRLSTIAVSKERRDSLEEAWNEEDAVKAELHFWCTLAKGSCVQDLSSALASEQVAVGKTLQKPFDGKQGMFVRRQRAQNFRTDTSDCHLEELYATWSDEDGLRQDALRQAIATELGICLDESQLRQALLRVANRFARGVSVDPATLQVFASLWQRLILGAVCQPLCHMDSCNDKDNKILCRHGISWNRQEYDFELALRRRG